tara:strand:+ start:717 stop:1373 length:657 start_codon:yes stop_codon:yes gene_type:complete
MSNGASTGLVNIRPSKASKNTVERSRQRVNILDAYLDDSKEANLWDKRKQAALGLGLVSSFFAPWMAPIILGGYYAAETGQFDKPLGIEGATPGTALGEVDAPWMQSEALGAKTQFMNQYGGQGRMDTEDWANMLGSVIGAHTISTGAGVGDLADSGQTLWSMLKEGGLSGLKEGLKAYGLSAGGDIISSFSPGGQTHSNPYSQVSGSGMDYYNKRVS